MFIVLHTTDGTEKRVNVNHIIYYNLYDKDSCTWVETSYHHVVVKETPLQIDTMLREMYHTVYNRT